jgi:cytochrome c oxidase subunit II
MPAGVRRRALLLVPALVAAPVVALVLAAGAAAGNGGLAPVPPVSPNGEGVTDVYWFILAFTGAIFLLVEGALVLFVVRYRRGRRARTADGPQIHGATRLEVIWTLVPVVILFAIGTFVFYKLPGISNPPSASAAEETTIEVEGNQFYWLFRYPNGGVSVGTMVAPADQVVREVVVAPDSDVIHSWWVPAFGPKVDAIPGRVNRTWFKAPEGTYVARCAELCGLQHAVMTANVRVVPREEYDRFIAVRTGASLELGREQFDNVCLSCHRLDETFIGPPIGGNPIITDRETLETLLRNGRGRMPAVGASWTDAQIDALVQHTRTLEAPEAAEEAPDGEQG